MKQTVKQPTTYREAGVDVRKAGAFVRQIQRMAERTRQPGLVGGIGGFGGLFDMQRAGRAGSVLVASADGVGTKLCLAKRAQWYLPLGVDLVAMNVNDLVCTGAHPLFFLDYIAAGRLNPQVLGQIVRGVARGCVEAGCVLLGGETAQMPLVYSQDDFDLAGFAVGVVDRAHLVDGRRVRPGDPVLGLEAAGLHANGFTLVQKVLSDRSLKRWARRLLKPTRIYVRPVLDLIARRLPVRALAHITGGSFQEKIPRVLPRGLGVRLHRKAWKVPAVFRWIQAAGVSENEMYRSFNMGIGMAVMLPPGAVSRAQRLLERHRLPSWVIGEVVRGRQQVEWVK